NRRAKIWLEHQQTDQHPDDSDMGDKCDAEFSHLPDFFIQRIGQKYQRRDLGDLSGLKTHPEETKPAPGTILDHPDTRNQYQAEPQNSDRQDRIDQATIPAVIDAKGNPESKESNRDFLYLSDDKKEMVAKFFG